MERIDDEFEYYRKKLKIKETGKLPNEFYLDGLEEFISPKVYQKTIGIEQEEPKLKEKLKENPKTIKNTIKKQKISNDNQSEYSTINGFVNKLTSNNFPFIIEKITQFINGNTLRINTFSDIIKKHTLMVENDNQIQLYVLSLKHVIAQMGNSQLLNSTLKQFMSILTNVNSVMFAIFCFKYELISNQLISDIIDYFLSSTGIELDEVLRMLKRISIYCVLSTDQISNLIKLKENQNNISVKQRILVDLIIISSDKLANNKKLKSGVINILEYQTISNNIKNSYAFEICDLNMDIILKSKILKSTDKIKIIEVDEDTIGNLAKKLGMSNDIRKAIFTILMSSVVN